MIIIFNAYNKENITLMSEDTGMMIYNNLLNSWLHFASKPFKNMTANIS